ncbi:hypothetical protein TWF696_001084 [Orbilia brochopaga]|uniref:Glycine-rich domain-containing protein 1 n=1 Tax=Orbilia brochopaga TaxID=3140254 RepID=A0AAV9VGB5_9PEZI
MVLSSGYGQHWLHLWSTQAMNHQKRTFSASNPAPNYSTSRYNRASHLSAADKLQIPAFTQFSKSIDPSELAQIPDPTLFSFAELQLDPSQLYDHTRLPTVAECATHLELLHAFYAIRKKVLSSAAWDKALGIEPETTTTTRKERAYDYNRRCYATKTYTVVKRDENFNSRREEKWPFYLKFAAVRFIHWAEAVAVNIPHGHRDTMLPLPPLDVLMVWHALLLNPTWFNSFENGAVKQLRDIPFPWQEIHKTIDTNKVDWPFNLRRRASAWFESYLDCDADLYEYIASETKPEKFANILKKHGALRDESSTKRGITLQDIDEAVLSHHEMPEIPDWGLIYLEEVVSRADEDPIKGLVDAVQRQSLFVDKMEKQLWIRSPALRGTLERAITRYRRFLQLFKFYPGKMLVPTLDIDLVWHTHQLSPFLYQAGTTKYARRIIDHNDKLGRPTLDDGFTRTKELYRIRFGQEYNVCTCWDCEALLSAAENAWDPDKDIDESAIAKTVHEQLAYHRAAEVARRKAPPDVRPDQPPAPSTAASTTRKLKTAPKEKYRSPVFYKRREKNSLMKRW